MRAYFLAVGVLVMLAGCSQDRDASQSRIERASAQAGTAGPALHSAGLNRRPPAEVAALPDRGELWAFDTARKPVRRGAYTWHPVQLSEQHALRAVVGGDLVVTAPDGQLIRLRYERHVEHPDGNWTWIGRAPGAMPGTEAMLTFGAKAVFGSIPHGDGEPLRVTTSAGRAWLMETDASAIAALGKVGTGAGEADYLLPPKSLGAAGAGTNLRTAMLTPSAATTSAVTTVDLVLGYTSGFASRLGGQSQAVTRLTYLVDRTNQAYANSQIKALVRLVRTIQVSYSDVTANNAALYDLTGVSCTELPDGSLDCEAVGAPASLQPLLTAREQYGADLVSLVRVFNNPENGGCGIAWLIGGGQVNIDATDEYAGMSVVSDSNGTGPGAFPDNGMVCRDETLAHELGHNMGSAHDRDTADGDDNVLQANEYGRYPYSFGYKTSTFYTVMAYGSAGLTPYLVFSNPNITICGGAPCGVAGAADNALSINQTVPIIATFRVDPSPVPRDFNGDGRSDVLWRNSSTGANTIWLSANSATPQPVSTLASQSAQIVGVGDFNGDGRADILWRNFSTGANLIWLSGNSATPQAVSTVASQAAQVVGVGDFNGDGRSDILWRNSSTGANTIWLSGNSASVQLVSTVASQAWKVVGVGDFNGDGRSDILWRNSGSGANTIWLSGNSASSQGVSTVGSQSWQVVGVGDFNGDGRSDILWRHSITGANSIWLSANSATPQAVGTVASQAWKVVEVGDFNGDGRYDILWRNSTSGANSVWLSANSATSQTLSPVPSQSWQVK